MAERPHRCLTLRGASAVAGDCPCTPSLWEAGSAPWGLLVMHEKPKKLKVCH